MKKEDILSIIQLELPFSQCKKNEGIYESSTIGEISIGLSYEDSDEGQEVYIYNLFVDGEYINISDRGTNENPLPDSILDELTNAWNDLIKST